MAAVYPVFLFWDWDDLLPARQKLIDMYGPNAIVKMKTPAPEHHILDALHIRPLEGSQGHDRAVILCAGANGHYEDNFTSKFVQWVKDHVGDVHIIAANYAGSYRSTGYVHPVTMARSVYTAVAYAHHCCAVPINNVLLYSQSMGGMAATLALPLLEQEWPDSRVRVLSDRSFDSFAAAMPGFVGSRLAPFAPLFYNIQFVAKDLASKLHAYGGHTVVVWSKQDDLIGDGNHVSEAISKLSARPDANLQIVTMLENQADEKKPAHLRDFYPTEIEEIFSGHVRRLLNLENADPLPGLFSD